MKAPRKSTRAVSAAKEEDAIPEADTLVGFAHPRLTAQLFGHDAAERELHQAFHSGRMHHGWLITGTEGIGKATLAWRFARYVLADRSAQNPDAGSLEVDVTSPAVRQVQALSNPGLLLLRRTWDSTRKRFTTAISVDEVRRLKSFLSFATEEDAWRIVIVDRADEMNANAANALLKSLEEPPRRTIFLLISSEPGRLLPTIHSRCRRLHLSPLEFDDLHQAMQAALASAADLPSSGAKSVAPQNAPDARLAALARGSVRQALILSAIGGLGLHDEILQHLSDLPHRDIEAIHRLGNKLAPVAAQQTYEAFFALLQSALGRIVRHAVTGSGGIGVEAEIAGRLASGGGVARWAELWETLARDKAETDAINLDRKALVLDVFAQLARVAGEPG